MSWPPTFGPTEGQTEQWRSTRPPSASPSPGVIKGPSHLGPPPRCGKKWQEGPMALSCRRMGSRGGGGGVAQGLGI